jgi:hypothetical protein
MSWERGREEIERLLSAGEISRVAPSELVARRLLADADAHVGLARKGADDDPSGALQLGYDAARKASAALLAVQGLRATTSGGHIAVVGAVRAQFGLPVFGRINRLRRRRNETEYPAEDSPGVTTDDARQAIAIATDAIAAATQLLETGKLLPFE